MSRLSDRDHWADGWGSLFPSPLRIRGTVMHHDKDNASASGSSTVRDPVVEDLLPEFSKSESDGIWTPTCHSQSRVSGNRRDRFTCLGASYIGTAELVPNDQGRDSRSERSYRTSSDLHKPAVVTRKLLGHALERVQCTYYPLPRLPELSPSMRNSILRSPQPHGAMNSAI